MKKIKVYLAGAIDCLTRLDAELWRNYAADALRKQDFEVINPLEVIDEKGNIIKQSLTNVERADIILAEMHFPVQHIGTVCELWEARKACKPIVVWGTQGKQSKFLHEIAYSYDSLYTALDEVIQIGEDMIRRAEEHGELFTRVGSNG